MPRAVDLDEHDEELAQRLEAAAEIERGHELTYRRRADAATNRCNLDEAFGLHRLANERSIRAHAFIEIARMLRADVERRAKCGRAA